MYECGGGGGDVAGSAIPVSLSNRDGDQITLHPLKNDDAEELKIDFFDNNAQRHEANG